MNARQVAAAALLATGLVALSAARAGPFDVEGHRGARGLAPENTLAAFAVAIGLGVTTLEADLAVTADDVVVVSHNARLNPDLTRDAQGRFLVGEGPAIRALTYDQLRTYDVGRLDERTRYAAGFRSQRPYDGERIPTLDALLALVRESERPVRLNLETKLTPDAPADAPLPEAFIQRVVARIAASGMIDRITIQSFDWRTLIELRRVAPAVRRSCLTQETAGTDNVASRDGAASPWTAGFDLRDAGGSVPRLVRNARCDVWSPYYRNVTPERVAEAHALGLEVLPWTVNEPADMRRLIGDRVDGLISDFPDRLLDVVRARGGP